MKILRKIQSTYRPSTFLTQTQQTQKGFALFFFLVNPTPSKSLMITTLCLVSNQSQTLKATANPCLSSQLLQTATTKVLSQTWKTQMMRHIPIALIQHSLEYFTLPHTFRADPTKFRAESEWNGRNGRNLVGMRCQ